jgi:hypothetical protein
MPARTLRDHVRRARERIKHGGYQVPEGVTVLDVARGYDALLEELKPVPVEGKTGWNGMPTTEYPEGSYTIR